MTQEWMKDSTLEGIDPAKMALLQSLIQQGSKKNQNEMLAFLMSAAANSKKNGLQFSPGEMFMIIILIANLGGGFVIVEQILIYASLILTVISLITYLWQNRSVLSMQE